MSALDKQEGGDHYQKLGDYQPWIVLSKWMTPEELKGAMKKEVITYLAREQDKGGRLDIKKAMHTLQIYLELTASEDIEKQLETVSDGNGWIEWNGGECPVNPNCIVSIKYRHGLTHHKENRADSYYWVHANEKNNLCSSVDIVAYKVIENP